MDFEEIKPPDVTWADKLLKALAPLNAALGGLWDTLSMVGGFTWQGMKDFYDGFLEPVGAWALGTGLPRLVEALDKGLQAVDWGKINEGLVKLWDALTPFAINAGEGLLWLWENALVPLGTWTMNNVVPLFIEGLTAAFDAFNATWESVQPGLMWLWDSFLVPVAQWTGGVIVAVLAKIVDGLKAFGDWCKKHPTTIENIAVLVGSFAIAWGLVNLAIGAWNTIGVIATTVTGAFGAAVAFLTSPIGLVVVAVGSLIAVVALLIKNWDAVKETAINAWESIKEAFGAAAAWFNETVVTPIASFFGGLWDGVKHGAGMLADFIQLHVIDPIVSAFNGMYNAVVGIVEGVINGFIGIINGFIRGINKVVDTINKIPGVDIPSLSTLGSVSIPRLASGGMAYGEVQAIVGDNHNVRQDPEVIAPLSNLQDMITAAILQRDIAGGGSGKIELRMILEDGTPFAEAMIDPMNRTAKNLGYGPVFRLETI